MVHFDFGLTICTVWLTCWRPPWPRQKAMMGEKCPHWTERRISNSKLLYPLYECGRTLLMLRLAIGAMIDGTAGSHSATPNRSPIFENFELKMNGLARFPWTSGTSRCVWTYRSVWGNENGGNRLTKHIRCVTWACQIIKYIISPFA